MSIDTGYDDVTADDGRTFQAYRATPDGGRGPGVLLFQEIFGINDNMRTIARRLAEAGFLTLVPDMFWRIEPRFERKDESGMGDAFAMVQQFDFGTAIDDIRATHAHLLSLDGCTGKVGAIGFCLGGGLAFAAATLSRVDGRGPDAAVCYYGSPINDLLHSVDSLECPALLHYGDTDPFITADKIAEVEAAVAGRPAVEVLHYDAGHAFSNWDAPSMYDQVAADLAWDRSMELLARHLM